jgi:hypothetical protein
MTYRLDPPTVQRGSKTTVAEQVMNARSRAPSGCALIEAKRYMFAPLPVSQPPGEGRPGRKQLGKIEARRTKDRQQ